ncbi:restriction endonuclease subunit S [Megasphaera sp.]|uniref:restriction endonuclease subunit S n=1 Tax=Megasphaera sp. TaxID=2023260 RepID=UPI0027BA675E|nr:restriction endonuclease subunit S [Megasphaera sp.]
MNKKKKPCIRFKGFTDDWEQRKLGDIVQITMGQSPNGETYSEKPSDYILVQGMADLKVGWVFPRVWTTQKTKTCDAGDLIMSVRAPAGAVGKTAYSAVIGRGVSAIKGNEFIYQTLTKRYLDGCWKKIAAGSTFESINFSAIADAEIMLPSGQEQKRIGRFFSNLDYLITLHQRKCEKLKIIKKSMLENCFPKNGQKVPKIRFSGFTGDWEQRKLGELAQFNPPSDLPEEFEYVDLESVIGTEMVSHRKELKKSAPSRAQRLARKGDVFYQTVRPYQKNNYIFKKDDKNYVFSTGYAQLRPYINGDFLFTLVQTENFVSTVLDNCTGTSYPAINSNILADIKVSYIESEDEQMRIGMLFKSLNNLITLHQSKLEKLQKIKKSMLERMFV